MRFINNYQGNNRIIAPNAIIKDRGLQEKETTTSYPEIPCEVCGHPRMFLAILQWCCNCGWNSQAALLGLQARFRIMAAVAACIVAGEIILLLKIPSIGFLYLPLACFLAGAIAFIPYREYRSVQRAGMSQGHRSPEVVASKLQRLQPQ